MLNECKTEYLMLDFYGLNPYYNGIFSMRGVF